MRAHATKTSRRLIKSTRCPTMTRTTLIRPYSVQTMTVNQYSKILNSTMREKYQIVDVREPDEFIAVNVQDKDIMNLPISQSWKWGTDIARHEHPLDPVKPVICVCRSGGRSMTFATFLSTVGFEVVYNLYGGMEEYAQVIDPTVRKTF